MYFKVSSKCTSICFKRTYILLLNLVQIIKFNSIHKQRKDVTVVTLSIIRLIELVKGQMMKLGVIFFFKFKRLCRSLTHFLNPITQKPFPKHSNIHKHNIIMCLLSESLSLLIFKIILEEKKMRQ